MVLAATCEPVGFYSARLRAFLFSREYCRNPWTCSSTAKWLLIRASYRNEFERREGLLIALFSMNFKILVQLFATNVSNQNQTVLVLPAGRISLGYQFYIWVWTLWYTAWSRYPFCIKNSLYEVFHIHQECESASTYIFVWLSKR